MVSVRVCGMFRFENHRAVSQEWHDSRIRGQPLKSKVDWRGFFSKALRAKAEKASESMRSSIRACHSSYRSAGILGVVGSVS